MGHIDAEAQFILQYLERTSYYPLFHDDNCILAPLCDSTKVLIKAESKFQIENANGEFSHELAKSGANLGDDVEKKNSTSSANPYVSHDTKVSSIDFVTATSP